MPLSNLKISAAIAGRATRGFSALLVSAFSLAALVLPSVADGHPHISRPAATRPNASMIAMQTAALHSGNVVKAAYSLRGTRYVMGGTSRSGFDCSGFVRYILSTTGGIALPRTATEQYYHGTPVAEAALEPGDLIFFKNTYRQGISHVGIYAGSGKFIHADNPSKGVREDDLNTPYYVAHYAGARRVLPEQMRRLCSE